MSKVVRGTIDVEEVVEQDIPKEFILWYVNMLMENNMLPKKYTLKEGNNYVELYAGSWDYIRIYEKKAGQDLKIEYDEHYGSKQKEIEAIKEWMGPALMAYNALKEAELWGQDRVETKIEGEELVVTIMEEDDAVW